MLHDNAPRQDSEKLMEVLDQLNAKDGERMLGFAAGYTGTAWQMKRDMLSPNIRYQAGTVEVNRDLVS
jgi:DNA polymerase V